MNRTYHCLNCKKHFYFFGESSKAFGLIVRAKSILRSEGFPAHNITGPSEAIQKTASCCNDPSIILKEITG